MGISVRTFAPFICFFTIIILSTNVSALGISPGRIDIYFEPSFNQSYTFYVRGGGIPNIEVTTTCPEFVVPEVDELLVTPGEKMYFIVDVNLPEEMGRYGLIQCGVIAEEKPEVREGMIMATAAVESGVWIRVPYPEKYIEAWLTAPNVEISEPVEFILPLVSRGLENVTATGVIVVTDASGEHVATLYTDVQFIESLGSGQLTATLDTDGLPAGRYFAEASIEYGGDKTAIAGNRFKIGDILIDITNVTYPEEIFPEDIVKFIIEVDSFWNSDIEDAFITLDIFEGSNKLGSTTSESFSIEAWSTKKLQIFWDTDGLEPGTYDLKFTVNYVDKSTEKTIQIEIMPPGNPYLLILIIAVIIAAIIAAAYLIRRMKKKKGEVQLA